MTGAIGSVLLKARGLRALEAATVGVDLTLEAGTCWGLWGGQGSGKTALLRALARLDVPLGGQLAWADKDVTRLPRWRLGPWRRFVALFLANPYTALEPWRPVRRLLGTDKAQVAAALRQAGLSPVVEGYQVRSLSGTERMRLLFARAWLDGPHVLLVDDAAQVLPFAAWTALVADWRAALGPGRALLLAGRHSEALAGADGWLVLCRGDGVEWGPQAAVAEQPVHPYTRWLQHDRGGQLADSSGCGFSALCAEARPICREQLPAPVEVAPGHWVRCHRNG